MKANDAKQGKFVVAKDKFPCKVVSYSVSKTGKHGHAKVHITVVDIFTNKKYEITESSSHNLKSPIVEKVETELVDIDDAGKVTY